MAKVYGVVPAAGEGTRLQPLTFSLPKQLVPLLGRAVIEYPLDDLRGIGIPDENIVVVVGYLGDLIREYLANRGYRVKFVVQEERLGIAHAVHVAIRYAGIGDEPFVVYLADNILLDDISVFYREFIEGDYDAFVLLMRVSDPSRFGVAVVEDGRITRVVEKPREPISDLAVIGVYFFRSAAEFEKVFSRLRPSWRGEYEISDVIHEYVRSGRRVGYGMVSRWKDVGTPESLLDAVRMLLESIEKPVVRGRVEGGIVDGNVVVEEGAVIEGVVEGPAYIGAGSYVGASARLEGFVSLEAGTKVLSGVLKNVLVLGEGTVIDVREARLTDSIIGRACRVTIRGISPSVKLVIGDKAVIEVGGSV